MRTTTKKSAQQRYRDQQAEWDAILRELSAARPGQCVTAFQVTTEQKKRMLARGERRVTLEELIETEGLQ